MKTATARKREHCPADGAARCLHPSLGDLQVICIENDQRPSWPHGLTCSETTRQPAVAELGVGWPVIGELPAEHRCVECFAARDVADVELDVVDLTIPTANTQERSVLSEMFRSLLRLRSETMSRRKRRLPGFRRWRARAQGIAHGAG